MESAWTTETLIPTTHYMESQSRRPWHEYSKVFGVGLFTYGVGLFLIRWSCKTNTASKNNRGLCLRHQVTHM